MKTLKHLLIAPFFACAVLTADNSTPPAAPAAPAPEKNASLAAAADPAAVEAVLKATHYDEMMGKLVEQQKRMIRQMVMRASMPGTSKEEVEAFQQKVLEVAAVGLSLDEIHAVAARSYGEVFTTDELRTIADFYNSAGGQAFFAKQSQIQQRIGAALRPRVEESTQKIQQMTRDFAAQQHAEAAAAKDQEQKASGAPAAPATGATPTLTLPPKS
jgi:hypothetical protein